MPSLWNGTEPRINMEIPHGTGPRKYQGKLDTLSLEEMLADFFQTAQGLVGGFRK